MTSSHVLFFSSDSSALYQADIYRCLALPAGHTIQFRYRPELIQERLRSAALKIKTGIIYFLTGNDMRIPTHKRNLSAHSIRQCSVTDAYLEEEIDQMTFILQLREFVSCPLDQIRLPLPSDALLPETLVSEALVERVRPITWLEAVRSVEKYFPNTLFCHIDDVLEEGSTPISVGYSETLKHSYFSIKEDSEYAIKCICYDPEMQNQSLLIDYKSDDIQLSNVFEFGVGAGVDARLLPLRTRVLKVPSSQIFLTFYSPKTQAPEIRPGQDRRKWCRIFSKGVRQPIDSNPSDPNYFRIWLKIERKSSRFRLFWRCSSGLALALVLTQLYDKLCFPCNIISAGFGILLAGYFAAELFNSFNKV
jgi:hypothetical protein